MLNSKIYECVSKSIVAKLIHPKTLGESTEWQEFIHLSFTTKVLGITEDMYIRTYLNETADPLFAVVDAQS